MLRNMRKKRLKPTKRYIENKLERFLQRILTMILRMFVCFLKKGGSSHSRFFLSLRDVTITSKGLHILTYTRHFRQLIFSVPHLLWHGASFYNGHLWWPMTLTLNAERLAVELSLPVLTTYVCRCWDSNIQPFICAANALTDCTTAAAL